MALPTKSVRIAGESVTGGQSVAHENSIEIKPEKSTLTEGFGSVRQQLVGRHPLEQLERTRRQRIDNANYRLLRTTQGIHAPLRLMAERRAASRVGRLPFMASSNAMLEVLDGRDEMIDFDDVFNDRFEPEVMATPHMVMEKHLKLFDN